MFEKDYLDAYNNKIKGNIPTELGQNPLIRLSLHSNQLTGNIPSELGRLTILNDLQLQNNKLGGTIPDEIFNALKLQRIELQFNDLEGTIPSSVSKLQNLNTLLLNDNDLDGTIPSEVALGNKTSVDFQGNYFSEVSCQTIQSLKVAFCDNFCDRSFSFPCPCCDSCEDDGTICSSR